MASETTESPDILMQYKRVGEASEGRIALIPGQDAEDREATARCLEEFSYTDFKQVLQRLAVTVARFPKSRVIILRTDRPGLLPFVLDEHTTALFRTDPVTAIRSMTYEAQEPQKLRKVADNTPIEVSPVRVGYDTLSDSFGDLVYICMRGNSVECPGCALWGDMDDYEVLTCKKRCQSRGLSYPFCLHPGRQWAGVAVESLLDSPLKKFYLPRPWAGGKSWIDRSELEEKYTAYKAEKEIACLLKAMG